MKYEYLLKGVDKKTNDELRKCRFYERKSRPNESILSSSPYPVFQTSCEIHQGEVLRLPYVSEVIGGIRSTTEFRSFKVEYPEHTFVPISKRKLVNRVETSWNEVVTLILSRQADLDKKVD